MSGDDDHLEEVPSRSVRRRSTLTPPDLTIDIEFERLSLTLPGVGTLMTGVTGNLVHGNLTAIMGPSGAGKWPYCF
jgi:ABC-type transport system involved in cytochrome bd biosynthesis fused ATPase/permease subunit